MADHVVSAKDVLLKESSSIRHAADRLDGTFNDLIEAILHSDSRVVVCGMGKSGHIAKKIFATFVSTGTPSMFLHPAEAFHGDLGMILSQDIVIAISNSGETEEVLKLIPFLKDNDNLIISLTGNP
ncbi:MAG TPA: KpsF/GutQ family sugar-phosphate isomerase, partial [Gammaproteobacteria bacterium]|nr:KpsF/GutQ family sugar-phosphate isomerase [Gammaproteobacteria bacterium]